MKRNTAESYNKATFVVDKGSQNIASKFAIISVTKDIERPVGLIEFIGSKTKLSAIAPSHVFDADTVCQ
ncbi:hypothetical protein INT46_004659 [Mucor plumbeus]|uniref:Uncharacterized protein n=1 Tax=Mucor plumbeus TaxID=97098 RepID=A0A8H7QSA1_9FUNG|nr:hypothetical protein INT46_004659 [Mucor plumbeus]